MLLVCCASDTVVAVRFSQMTYAILVSLSLGFVQAENSAVLELTGDAPTVHFGELGGSHILTLTHNSSEDELVCSLREDQGIRCGHRGDFDYGGRFDT